MMEALSDKKIGDVAADLRAAAVFSKYGIDFCDCGQQPIIDAATGKDVNLDNLQKELEKVLAAANSGRIDY